MKTLLGALLSALGVLAILLDAIDYLPEGFPLPGWALSLGTIVPLLLYAVGLQDEFEEGKRGMLDLIKAFMSDPYRALAISVLANLANGLLAIAEPSSPVALAAHVLLAILAAGGFLSGSSKAYARRQVLQIAKLNKLKGI